MSSVKAIYAGIRALGIAEEDDRRALYERVTGKRRLREMSPSDKEGVVQELRRLGFKTSNNRRQLSGPYAKKLQALWITAWNLGIARSREDGAMLAFIRRQTGIEDTRFLQEAYQADKVIEALKSWIAREGGVNWSNQDRPNWLRDHGAKVALAQWIRLTPDFDNHWTPAFQAEVFAISGQKSGLSALRSADWRLVMNVFGARIRGAGK